MAFAVSTTTMSRRLRECAVGTVKHFQLVWNRVELNVTLSMDYINECSIYIQSIKIQQEILCYNEYPYFSAS